MARPRAGSSPRCRALRTNAQNLESKRGRVLQAWRALSVRHEAAGHWKDRRASVKLPGSSLSQLHAEFEVGAHAVDEIGPAFGLSERAFDAFLVHGEFGLDDVNLG